MDDRGGEVAAVLTRGDERGEERRMHCVACGVSVSLGAADTGDEITCPLCGMVQEVGERVARVPGRRRLRILRSGSAGRVRAPLRVAWRCALLAVAVIVGCLVASQWSEVRATVVGKVHDLCHRLER